MCSYTLCSSVLQKGFGLPVKDIWLGQQCVYARWCAHVL